MSEIPQHARHNVQVGYFRVPVIHSQSPTCVEAYLGYVLVFAFGLYGPDGLLREALLISSFPATVPDRAQNYCALLA